MDEPDMEPTFGPRVVDLPARYRVDPVAGGKRLQAVSLHLDDGRVWVRSYRPIRDELQYVDKRVLVTGRSYENSPYVQTIMAVHFELESIRLAPGETPYPEPPTQIPPPPVVRTLAQAAERIGMWAHCQGVVESLEVDGHSAWSAHGRLRLEDGSLEISSAIMREVSADLVGQPATLLGTVHRSEGGLGLSAYRGCAGYVENCRMDQDQIR